MVPEASAIHLIFHELSLAVNKRLDEWVNEDQMDLARLEVKKETKTPMKMMNGSRPSSPERDMSTPQQVTILHFHQHACLTGFGLFTFQNHLIIRVSTRVPPCRISLYFFKILCVFHIPTLMPECSSHLDWLKTNPDKVFISLDNHA